MIVPLLVLTAALQATNQAAPPEAKALKAPGTVVSVAGTVAGRYLRLADDKVEFLTQALTSKPEQSDEITYGVLPNEEYVYQWSIKAANGWRVARAVLTDERGKRLMAVNNPKSSPELACTFSVMSIRNREERMWLVAFGKLRLTVNLNPPQNRSTSPTKHVYSIAFAQ